MAGKVLSFNDLWTKANTADRSYNGFVYHSCCDIWTSRGAEPKRMTHGKHLKWRKLMASFGSSIENRKQALLTKMTEEHWRLPAILNQVCQARNSSTMQQQAAFRPYRLELPRQCLQVGTTSQEFLWSNQHCPSKNAFGIIYTHKLMNCSQVLFFKSRPSKTFLFCLSRVAPLKANLQT